MDSSSKYLMLPQNNPNFLFTPTTLTFLSKKSLSAKIIDIIMTGLCWEYSEQIQGTDNEVFLLCQKSPASSSPSSPPQPAKSSAGWWDSNARASICLSMICICWSFQTYLSHIKHRRNHQQQNDEMAMQEQVAAVVACLKCAAGVDLIPDQHSPEHPHVS